MSKFSSSDRCCIKNTEIKKDCNRKDCKFPIIPAVTLTKTADNTTVVVGQQVTFTITATNNTSKAITDVTITDTLPLGFTFVSATPAGFIMQGRNIIYHFDVLLPGSTVITIVALSNNAGTFVNTATLKINNHKREERECCDTRHKKEERDCCDTRHKREERDFCDTRCTPKVLTASVTITVLASTLVPITKTVSMATVMVGNNVTFIISITNNSGAPITGVTIVDLIPFNFVIVSTPPGTVISGNLITINVGTLAAGGSANIVITAQATSPGDFTNTALVTYTTDRTTITDAVSVSGVVSC